MRTAKTLIRLGGCTGCSESSLGAHAILLVGCREVAQATPVLVYMFSESLAQGARVLYQMIGD